MAGRRLRDGSVCLCLSECFLKDLQQDVRLQGPGCCENVFWDVGKRRRGKFCLQFGWSWFWKVFQSSRDSLEWRTRLVGSGERSPPFTPVVIHVF